MYIFYVIYTLYNIYTFIYTLYCNIILFFTEIFHIYVIRTSFHFFSEHTFQNVKVEYCGRVKPRVSSKMCEYSHRGSLKAICESLTNFCLFPSSKETAAWYSHRSRRGMANSSRGRRCVYAQEKETGGYRGIQVSRGRLMRY